MMGKRLVVAVLAVLVAVGALIVDPAQPDRAPAGPADLAPGQLAPLASRSEATESTWFCAGGTVGAASAADQTIAIFNPTDAPVTGTVQVFPDGAAPTGRPVRVPAFGRLAVHLADVLGAPPAAEGVKPLHAAAIVELASGGQVVEQQVRGIGGWDSARCVTQASAEWFFPWGRTALGSTMQLSLFNPFPADAVVDVAFDTEEGFRSPEPFEGVLVPARRLVTLDVGGVVTRRERVSTKVVARTGRLVAHTLQSVTGSDGSIVLDLSPGASAPAQTWYFAEGRADADTVERFALFNPGETTAEVDLTLLRPLAAPGAEIEPFELRVPPNGYAEVVVNRESRVALPLRHTAIVESTNGVGVVAARVQASSTVAGPGGASGLGGTTSTTAAGPPPPTTAPPTTAPTTTVPPTTVPTTAAATTAPPTAETTASTAAPAAGAPAATEPAPPSTAAPSPVAPTAPAAPPSTTAPPVPTAPPAPLAPLPPGLAISLGSPVVAARWLAVTVASADTPGARLTVFNQSDANTVGLTVRAYSDGKPLDVRAPASVDPRRRVDIEVALPAGFAAASVVVEAAGPVVVETFAAYNPVPDISGEPAVPQGAEVPRPLG